MWHFTLGSAYSRASAPSSEHDAASNPLSRVLQQPNAARQLLCTFTWHYWHHVHCLPARATQPSQSSQSSAIIH